MGAIAPFAAASNTDTLVPYEFKIKSSLVAVDGGGDRELPVPPEEHERRMNNKRQTL
jgi:hypothetical protein